MPLLASEPSGAGNRLVERLRQMFISGAAITVPLVVTLLVLAFAVNFILGLISPAVTVIADNLDVGHDFGTPVMEGIAVLVLVATTLAIGFVAETRSGDGLEKAFDTAMARIPGIGSVYTSFNEMSKMLLSNDTQSFRDVKLVEYPTEGTYTVGFVTAETPPEIEDAAGYEDMTTLFMPMAPNPVMGGFVMHISEERVHDVDLTVEQGVRSIVTSGVAVNGDDGRTDGEIVDFGRIRQQAREGVSDLGALSQRTAGDLRELTRDDLTALKDQTSDQFGVIWTGEDDETDATLHYTLERTGDEGTDTADTGGSSADGGDGSSADGGGGRDGGDR